MKLLREGKVKKVYEIDENTLEFHFTDNISVFDKVIPSAIPFKGESLCRTSAYWFQKVADLGVETHFLGTPAPDRMRVKRIDVVEDMELLRGRKGGYLIPLEFIARYYLAGSLFDKVRKGKITPEQLGYASADNATYGSKLPSPLFEVTTKLEEVDRKLTYEEGMSLAGLSQSEFNEIRDAVMSIDAMLEEEVSKRGLVHADGKKEFAWTNERRLMLIDTFGTADEDRFWEADELARGKVVERSKEMVRQYYRDIGYHARLMEARGKGLPEPDIPPLPDEMIGKVSELYKEMYERLTGRPF